MSDGLVYLSKSDMVTAALRELISSGQLSPGMALRQQELADRFRVSATPIREAMRRLESEGLIAYDPHKGATVTIPDLDETEENLLILASLESLAGRLAVVKVTDEELSEIEALHAKVAACPPGSERLNDLNREFHFRIYECAHSPTLLMLMRLLWRSFPNGPQAGRPHDERVDQHSLLVQALRARDAKTVASVIEEHTLGSVEYLRGQRRGSQ
ncbi:MAG: GntR family transcriptional regulator [Actinomycetota bacterium]|nr:GntR family transcriptional regulator [Actinomycetota bacterium]